MIAVPDRKAYVRWLPPIGLALLVLLLPLPAGITQENRLLLAIFLALVTAFITRPLSIGAVALIALAAALTTRALSTEAAFAAFSAPVVWLIVAALVLARSMMESGLSHRIAYACVARFGTSPLRLGYALALADLLLAPIIPSDTARAGGIVSPVARSLAEANGSHPGPTAVRLGGFLMQSVYHVGITTAAMFVTSMSANPLIVDLAQQATGVRISWSQWFLAASLPGGIALLLLPWVIYHLNRPELVATADAQRFGREQLAAMGPMTSAEKGCAIILLLVIGGWMTQPWHGLSIAAVAVTGVALLLLTGVLRWDAVLTETRAWDALIWFGVVLLLAQSLSHGAVIQSLMAPLTAGLQIPWWPAAIIILVALYAYAHYFYASMTAQIVTLYPVFVAVAIANAVPPIIAVLPFAFFSSLCASLTHYGSGSTPVVFGHGYVSQGRWWRTGFVVVLLQIVIWMGVGLFWWRLLKLY